jgi:hypothetical protein
MEETKLKSKQENIKGLSSELKHNLGETDDILGIVKTNASVIELTGTSIQEVNKLTPFYGEKQIMYQKIIVCRDLSKKLITRETTNRLTT